MSSTVRNARKVVGRRIVAVELNEFDSERAGETRAQRRSFNPVLILDDGSRLSFMTDETETGEYGLQMLLAPPARKAGAP